MSRAFLQTLFQAATELGSKEQGNRVAVDLAFIPDTDFADQLRRRELLLFGLGSRRPLVDHDLLIAYPERLTDLPLLLQMLELGGVPTRSSERATKDPLVVFAGPVSMTPAAAATNGDAFLVGDAEAALADVFDLLVRAEQAGWDRGSRVFRLADIDGIFVPAPIPGTDPKPEQPTMPVQARWLTRFPNIGSRHLTPLAETEAGGVVLEIARRQGPAGDPSAPLLCRRVEQTLREAERIVAETGCGELVLGGSGAGSHPEIVPLMEALNQRLFPHGVHVRLEEIDPGRMEPALARELRKGHRSELVFAPVEVSSRLRKAAGRPQATEELLQSAETARRGGWAAIRFRVILGFPGETNEDREEWARFIEAVVGLKKKGSQSPWLTLELLPFIPRPYTRWESEDGVSEAVYRETATAWRRRFRRLKIRLAEHSLREATAETALLRDEIVSAEGFGVPPWKGGRRPKRAARGHETRQAERFRLRFSKDEPFRFFSHLDVTRAFSRAFCKSQLPIAVSNGKDRRPKVSFGPPLPLGMTSGAEFLDVTFRKELPESFVSTLNHSLVEGLAVVACGPIRTEPASLNNAIQLATYEVSFSDTLIHEYLGGISFDELKIRLESRAADVQTSEQLPVTKVRGKVSRTFNAKPSLIRIEVVRDDGGRPALSLMLTLNRPDSVRPELLTATLVDWTNIEERLLRVHRSGLYIPGRKKDLDPLEVVASGFKWWRQPVRGGTVL
jgi:radical SAM-linked protein